MNVSVGVEVRFLFFLNNSTMHVPTSSLVPALPLLTAAAPAPAVSSKSVPVLISTECSPDDHHSQHHGSPRRRLSSKRPGHYELTRAWAPAASLPLLVLVRRRHSCGRQWISALILTTLRTSAGWNRRCWCSYTEGVMADASYAMGPGNVSSATLARCTMRPPIITIRFQPPFITASKSTLPPPLRLPTTTSHPTLTPSSLLLRDKRRGGMRLQVYHNYENMITKIQISVTAQLHQTYLPILQPPAADSNIPKKKVLATRTRTHHTAPPLKKIPSRCPDSTQPMKISIGKTSVLLSSKRSFDVRELATRGGEARTAAVPLQHMCLVYY
ncbi:hypothetical protein BDV95DRAFT_572312 [Massariosphaeria phaeospora]|uniref:Uncharacterized protein n=1 Tax=Massariosphaeria phaeospora TaxID=100035 RepID=A0A7C8M8D7_9PLEO|nr:hypothetical protein BDV95DRAFT_572312 [Massariosphaeria phaeospora]